MGAVNHDLTATSPFAVPIPSYPLGFGGFYSVPFLFDWAALKKSQAWTLNPNASDIINFTTIPIGAQIHGVVMDVPVAPTDAGTATIEIGDYSDLVGTAIDANGHFGSTPISVMATGYHASVAGDAYFAAQKIYTAAAYLGIHFAAGTCTELKTGKMWIVLKVSFMVFPAVDPITGDFVTAPSVWH